MSQTSQKGTPHRKPQYSSKRVERSLLRLLGHSDQEIAKRPGQDARVCQLGASKLGLSKPFDFCFFFWPTASLMSWPHDHRAGRPSPASSKASIWLVVNQYKLYLQSKYSLWANTLQSLVGRRHCRKGDACSFCTQVVESVRPYYPAGDDILYLPFGFLNGWLPSPPRSPCCGSCRHRPQSISQKRQCRYPYGIYTLSLQPLVSPSDAPPTLLSCYTVVHSAFVTLCYPTFLSKKCRDMDALTASGLPGLCLKTSQHCPGAVDCSHCVTSVVA